MRVFFYKEGLCRLATCEYRSPNPSNLDNLYMHLTNYAINKFSSAYVSNKGSGEDNVGHKRSLTFCMEYLREQGHDTDKVMSDIKSNIIKTICAV
jgi:tubulin polyglutamylase TTLL6/13